MAFIVSLGKIFRISPKINVESTPPLKAIEIESTFEGILERMFFSISCSIFSKLGSESCFEKFV